MFGPVFCAVGGTMFAFNGWRASMAMATFSELQSMQGESPRFLEMSRPTYIGESDRW